MTRSTRRPTTRIGRLVRGLAVSLIALLALEGLARIVTFSFSATSLGWALTTPIDATRCRAPIRMAGDLAPGIDEIWACPPDHPYRVISNNMGLRRRTATSPVKPAGVKRIYCLGDSFTFGTGVANDEAWPALLEEQLAGKVAAEGVEVLNAGIGGYGLEQEVALFASRGIRSDPDLVILQVLFNDVPGYHPTIRAIFARSRSGVADGTLLEGFAKRLRWFHRRHPKASALLDLLYKIKQPVSPEQVLALARGERPTIDVEGLELDAGTAAVVRHGWSVWTDPAKAAELATYQEMNERDFTKLVTLVRSREIPLLVVYFPTLTSLALRRQGEDPAAHYYAELTRRHGIRFLDLSETFDRGESSRYLFLWPWDMHCSFHGNRLAARRIEAVLAEERFGIEPAGRDGS